jgi:thiol:disulfide interchange protein DsbD
VCWAGPRTRCNRSAFCAAPSAAEARTAPTFEKVATVADLDTRLEIGEGAQTRDAGFLCRLVRQLQGDGALHFRRSARSRHACSRSSCCKADVTANSDADKELLKRFGLFGPPGIIFFERPGQVKSPTCASSASSLHEQFLPTLERVLR